MGTWDTVLQNKSHSHTHVIDRVFRASVESRVYNLNKITFLALFSNYACHDVYQPLTHGYIYGDHVCEQ